ncbi:hypothetical protein CRG98_012058 [Punica granatum]|uniref:Uncharacterized protein n=1 Tax=Punica granatum TaxID=22663 RepID=A0A2I0KG42_PUNGR|nr:hypothetical protein CRG98_012058 [Punica granatum]
MKRPTVTPKEVMEESATPKAVLACSTINLEIIRGNHPASRKGEPKGFGYAKEPHGPYCKEMAVGSLTWSNPPRALPPRFRAVPFVQSRFSHGTREVAAAAVRGKRVDTLAPVTARCKIGLVGLLRGGSRRSWVVPNVPSPRQAQNSERKFGKNVKDPIKRKWAKRWLCTVDRPSDRDHHFTGEGPFWGAVYSSVDRAPGALSEKASVRDRGCPGLSRMPPCCSASPVASGLVICLLFQPPSRAHLVDLAFSCLSCLCARTFASDCRVMNSNSGFGRGFSCREPVDQNGVLTHTHFFKVNPIIEKLTRASLIQSGRIGPLRAEMTALSFFTWCGLHLTSIVVEMHGEGEGETQIEDGDYARPEKRGLDRRGVCCHGAPGIAHLL